jgi:hypothetical protein
MNSYTIYNINGEIIKTIMAPMDMLDIQLKDGEYAILGAYSSNDFYVDTTNVHQAIELPVKPHSDYKFDYVNKQWIDPRNLDKVKAQQWVSIKSKRDEVEFGPFEYNGMIFDGDIDAQRRLNTYAAISKDDDQFIAMFILANNTRVELTAIDFINIQKTKVAQVAQAFDKAALLREQIQAATTKEQVENILW